MLLKRAICQDLEFVMNKKHGVNWIKLGKTYFKYNVNLSKRVEKDWVSLGWPGSFSGGVIHQ